MTIPENIFKSYDIRGLYPQELNEENISYIIKAIYIVLQKQSGKTDNLSIAIGRDMRLSSPSLFRKAQEALIEMGAQVIDIGLVSTPTFYLAVYKNKYDGGIQISASHNPKEYNGIKIVRSTLKGLVKIGKGSGMEEIQSTATKEVFDTPAHKGTISKKEGVLEEEIQTALELTENPKVKKFKIVADAANAMGATYIDALFKSIDADLVRMNFDLDGNFPAHQPDPLQKETLVDLQKKVLEEQADLGLAPDGDGDRLFFIDEKGEIVPPSFITALVAKELLKKQKGAKILFDIRYTLTPQEIVKENEGVSIVTKVGHAFITQKMSEVLGLFAGESSGHYYFKETGNGESQVPIILFVLKILTEEGKTLSELVEEIRRSYESGEINFKVINAKEIIQVIQEKYSSGTIDLLDGIAIAYPNWRFSLRTSNTEPLLRLNLEARTYDTMKTKTEELVSLINSFEKHD